MSWGERIREARGDRPQAWLAAEVGVDQSRVSAWERGALIGDAHKLALSAALGIHPSLLFPWADFQPPESPGSTPGDVGAASDGPVVQDTGVGFPQAQIEEDEIPEALLIMVCEESE